MAQPGFAYKVRTSFGVGWTTPAITREGAKQNLEHYLTIGHRGSVGNSLVTDPVLTSVYFDGVSVLRVLPEKA